MQPEINKIKQIQKHFYYQLNRPRCKLHELLLRYDLKVVTEKLADPLLNQQHKRNEEKRTVYACDSGVLFSDKQVWKKCSLFQLISPVLEDPNKVR